MRDRQQPAGLKPEEISVVVAHDHALFRESLARLAHSKPDVKVVGEVSEGCELAAAVAALQPDVLLLQPSVAGADVIQALRSIVDNSPTTKVLLLLSRVDPEVIIRALQAGARGYLAKASRMDQVVNAIRSIHAGKTWGDTLTAGHSERRSRVSSGQETHRGDPAAVKLTRRERQITILIAHALSNKQIARQLGIGEHTVKTHLVNIFRKLHIRGRLELALHAIDPEEGLLMAEAEKPRAAATSSSK
jgi:DNA-binding NarL/FixJ family response regulator